jgi:ABC-2 type transport system permease protein
MADVMAKGSRSRDLRRYAAVGSTPVTVELDVVDAESDYLPEGFSYSAPTMLVLFVFINAMAGGAAMIQSRTLGIYDRMLAARSPPVRSSRARRPHISP